MLRAAQGITTESLACMLYVNMKSFHMDEWY